MPDTVVVSTRVPDGGHDDETVASRILAAAEELARTARSCGATVTGVAWKVYALDAANRRAMLRTGEGPDCSVNVPVSSDTSFRK